ncbi:hypothetical protein SHIRM173S_00791 [Streptomyces hirsutus]
MISPPCRGGGRPCASPRGQGRTSPAARRPLPLSPGGSFRRRDDNIPGRPNRHRTNTSPTIPSGFPTWTVWQYTSTGSVGGVAGTVDRNQFNGSRDRPLALADNT